MAKIKMTNILNPVQRSCHKNGGMQYEISKIYYTEVMTNFFLKICQMSRSKAEFLKSLGPVGKTNIQCLIDSGSMSVQMTATCWHNSLHKSNYIPLEFLKTDLIVIC